MYRVMRDWIRSKPLHRIGKALEQAEEERKVLSTAATVIVGTAIALAMAATLLSWARSSITWGF